VRCFCALRDPLGVDVEHQARTIGISGSWDWGHVTWELDWEALKVAPFVICSELGALRSDAAVYWSDSSQSWVSAKEASVYHARDVDNVILPTLSRSDARWTLNPLAFNLDESSEERLSEELKCFCFIESLPFMDAYELSMGDVSRHQAYWLMNFIERWNQADI
jgi:hypothetical protein